MRSKVARPKTTGKIPHKRLKRPKLTPEQNSAIADAQPRFKTKDKTIETNVGRFKDGQITFEHLVRTFASFAKIGSDVKSFINFLDVFNADENLINDVLKHSARSGNDTLFCALLFHVLSKVDNQFKSRVITEKQAEAAMKTIRSGLMRSAIEGVEKFHASFHNGHERIILTLLLGGGAAEYLEIAKKSHVSMRQSISEVYQFYINDLGRAYVNLKNPASRLFFATSIYTRLGQVAPWYFSKKDYLEDMNAPGAKGHMYLSQAFRPKTMPNIIHLAAILSKMGNLPLFAWVFSGLVGVADATQSTADPYLALASTFLKTQAAGAFVKDMADRAALTGVNDRINEVLPGQRPGTS